MITFTDNQDLESDDLNQNFADLANGTGFNDDSIVARHIETQQSWIPLSLKNSWVAYSTDWTTSSYWKDSQGFVHLTGLIKDGSGNIATLPIGYRPAFREVYHIICSGEEEGRVDILPDGEISPVSIPNNTWVTLSDITFYAEN